MSIAARTKPRRCLNWRCRRTFRPGENCSHPHYCQQCRYRFTCWLCRGFDLRATGGRECCECRQALAATLDLHLKYTWPNRDAADHERRIRLYAEHAKRREPLPWERTA